MNADWLLNSDQISVFGFVWISSIKFSGFILHWTHYPFLENLLCLFILVEWADSTNQFNREKCIVTHSPAKNRKRRLLYLRFVVCAHKRLQTNHKVHEFWLVMQFTAFIIFVEGIQNRDMVVRRKNIFSVFKKEPSCICTYIFINTKTWFLSKLRSLFENNMPWL